MKISIVALLLFFAGIFVMSTSTPTPAVAYGPCIPGSSQWPECKTQCPPCGANQECYNGSCYDGPCEEED